MSPFQLSGATARLRNLVTDEKLTAAALNPANGSRRDSRDNQACSAHTFKINLPAAQLQVFVFEK